MIVDDAPRNLQVLGNILRNQNYKISVASTGRQALTMVKKFLPDIILLDVMMPELNGFQVCRQLKSTKQTKNIPIIFLTARTQTEDILKGFELGAVDYVTKPFNTAELLARVRTHIQLKKAQQEILRLERKTTALAMAVTANHEINQPLTVLKGNFEIFRNSIGDTELTPKQERWLLKIENSIGRIQGILQKFMDAHTVRLEEYFGSKKQVIFEEPENS